MRSFAIAIAAIATVSLYSVPASSQSLQIGPGGVRVDDGRREVRRDRDVCRELRAACLKKDRLGEQGEGNCRRYRQTCR